MKIILFGCDGQLGWELQRSLAVLGELTSLDLDGTDFSADFENPVALTNTVRALRPDVIVNAAAHTAVDEAEARPELAAQLNANAPRLLAAEAASLGALLVHYSTDYVFEGRGNTPHDEDAPTAPVNVYGRTKLEGERFIRASGCRHLILRSSWIYGVRGNNFARTILKLAAERDTLDVVDDQIGAPTGADLLADVTAHAVRAVLCDGSLAGTYHAAASGETSRFAYACFVIDWARRNRLPVRARADGVRAVPSNTLAGFALRPLNSRLATDRLRRAFGLTLPHWQAGVERMLTETCH